MKLIENLLDSLRPMFEEKGRFHMMKPLFEAADNFFFEAAGKTGCAPHGRDPMDVKRYMSLVIVALMPCLAAGLYYFGWRVLAVVVVSYVAGGIVEVAFAIVRKEEIAEGFLVTGLIFPLVLPPGLPLWAVAVGVMFGTLVGKEIFGGTGRNLFNPAIVGRVFLAFSYARQMTSTWMEPGTGAWGRLNEGFALGVPDGVTAATPLGMVKAGEMTPLMDLFLGRIAGSIGETCVPAIVLGGVFLVVVGVANWRSIVATLGSFTILGAILRATTPDHVQPVIHQLCSGSILFGAFFMVTDPVSSPVTQSGKWAYGIIIGSTAMLIRTFAGYPEGVMFGILLGNICAPLIDEVVVRSRRRRYAREG